MKIIQPHKPNSFTIQMKGFQVSKGSLHNICILITAPQVSKSNLGTTREHGQKLEYLLAQPFAGIR